MMSQPASVLSIAGRLPDDLRARLLAYPNVTDAGIGLKMKNGAYLSEPVVVVFVSNKLPLSRLHRAARLPRKIDGLPLDVQEELNLSDYRFSQGDGDERPRVRPLRSGLNICTSTVPEARGSLGCFAARNSDQKKVLVSNYHILFRDRGLPGMDDHPNKVYQPVQGESNQVGVVDEDSGSIGGSLDCAMALLSEEGSCFCCTHTIPHENKAGDIPLVGVATAQLDQKVYKMGAKTGLTVGKIVNLSKSIDGAVDYSEMALPAGDSFNFSNLIQIVFWDEAAGDYDPTQPFSQGGDSGSVIYNEAHEIVGLHFSSNFNPATGRHYAFACHIQLVENELGITIPGTRNYSAAAPPPPPPALAALDTPVSSSEVLIAGAQLRGQADLRLWWCQVEPQLRQTTLGNQILELIRLHGYEIMHLVNHNRDVTVIWQRGKGPAFTAAIARSIRQEDYPLPVYIEGSSALELASKMAAALMKHGSRELADTVQAYQPWFLHLVEKLGSARNLVSVMAEIEARPTA